MPLTTVQPGMLGTPQPYNFKNRIINGAMVINQRGFNGLQTGFLSPYTLDRWQAIGSASFKYSIQQNAGSVTPPSGFTNYLGVTSASAYSVSSSDTFYISQKIEGFNTSDLGWGTASAKTITLSFQVYSSLTGTFGGALTNSATNRSYPFSYTVSAANTWEYKTITIAGDTTGTWFTTNVTGIALTFSLGAGSTFSGTAGAWAAGNFISVTGATSVVGTNGATFYITGVQLEVGVTATGFDYRPYGTELALCQRYCVRYSNGAIGTFCYFPVASANDAATTAQGTIQFPVSMRSASGMTLTTTGTAANYSLYSAGAVRACTVVPTLAVVLNDAIAAQITLTVASGLTAGHSSNVLGTNSATPYLLFQSEL